MAILDIETGQLTEDNDIAIRQSLEYRLLTDRGEVEMLPNYGTSLYEFRGRRFTSSTPGEITAICVDAISGFDNPLIDIDTVQITTSDEGDIGVSIDGSEEIIINR